VSNSSIADNEERKVPHSPLSITPLCVTQRKGVSQRNTASLMKKAMDSLLSLSDQIELQDESPSMTNSNKRGLTPATSRPSLTPISGTPQGGPKRAASFMDAMNLGMNKRMQEKMD